MTIGSLHRVPPLNGLEHGLLGTAAASIIRAVGRLAARGAGAMLLR